MKHKLLHAGATARVLGLIVLFSLPACNGDSGGNDTTCGPGTERCPCDRGNCNAGLACMSNVCVQGSAGSGGTAGNPQGGSGGTNAGGTNAGGTNTGGASGGTGGQSVGGTGGHPAGGAGSGGVATGGSGGVSGGGGTGGTTCENTQTDPMNCGQCGNVCKNQDSQFDGRGCQSEQCCIGGSCAPYFGACITEASGFGTCADYCSSIGEQCVAGGCSTRTWNGYGIGAYCTNFMTFDYANSDPCDSPIEWTATSTYVRCCCTDTQP